MFRKSLILPFLIILLASNYVKSQTDQTADTFAISRKPKPSYTDKARGKKLEGTVILRVTFLANGEIGDVIDITKKKKKKMLNYGLTAHAIEAAKEIKFTPAKKNGEPITVVKIVEYTFTIY